MALSVSNIALSPFHLLFWTARQLSKSILFLLSPFFIVLYYSSYIFAPIIFPFQVLAKLESVYIFCGTAAVIGISTGCILGLTNSLLYSALSLTSATRSPSPSSSSSSSDIVEPTRPAPGSADAAGLSAATPHAQGIHRLREERRRRRAEREHQVQRQLKTHPRQQSSKAPPTTPPPKKAKSIPTILEEEDEEDYRAGLEMSFTITPSASSRDGRRSGPTPLRRRDDFSTESESDADF
ncbi:hypothetical protein BDZ91DRAFT_778779 [Kalaharituber pfeilii]|nr:hypothetical protein BDZ91DRAFT_778779 [Kalaharituber pfeilii]